MKVPTTEITDPLAITPLRVVDVDWRDGYFILALSDTVNQLWIQAFQTFQWSQAMVPPRAWRISEGHASAPGPEHLAEQIIGEFREWMPLVTARYRMLLQSRMREEERKQQAATQAAQERLERRRRLRGLL